MLQSLVSMISTGRSPTTNPAPVHFYGIVPKKVRDSLCKTPFHSSFWRRKYSILFVSNVSGEIVGWIGIPRQIRALRGAESSHHVRGCAKNKRLSKARTDTALSALRHRILSEGERSSWCLLNEQPLSIPAYCWRICFFFFWVSSGLWNKLGEWHAGTQGLAGVWMRQFLRPYFGPLSNLSLSTCFLNWEKISFNYGKNRLKRWNHSS